KFGRYTMSIESTYVYSTSDNYADPPKEGSTPYLNETVEKPIQHVQHVEHNDPPPSIEKLVITLRDQHGFEMLKKLGAGAFGQVWMCKVPSSNQISSDLPDRIVAVKFQLKSKHTSMEKEVSLVRGLKHPNIVQIFD